MQSDPNPTNFKYCLENHSLVLLDFGATHKYPAKFKQLYKALIKAGVEQDRDAILSLSKEIGFLTG